MAKSDIYTIAMRSWHTSIPQLLETAGVGPVARAHGKVLIKPNLVEALAPPITTPAQMIEAIALYLLDYLPASAIFIGEGSGAMDYTTHHCFHKLGYTAIATKLQVELIDLNEEELTHKVNPDCTRWPEIYLPKILDEVFLISVAQLKAHSLSTVTLNMKNMMGCAPPSHYQAGGWNKSAFHSRIHEAIFDLNRYRTPDCAIIDGSIGMAQAHLWGPQCDPPVEEIVTGFDPVACDSYGASLLGKDWRNIRHISMANGVLGQAEHYNHIPVDYNEKRP